MPGLKGMFCFLLFFMIILYRKVLLFKNFSLSMAVTPVILIITLLTSGMAAEDEHSVDGKKA